MGGSKGLILPGASLEQGTTCWIQNHWIGKEGGLLPTSSNHSQASPLEEEGFFSLAGVFSTSRALPERGARDAVPVVPLGRCCRKMCPRAET